MIQSLTDKLTRFILPLFWSLDLRLISIVFLKQRPWTSIIKLVIMYTDRLERCIPSNRASGHQEALEDIGNLPNRTGSSDYDPQLPLYLRQREPQGLDDSFVIKHTTDNTLSRYLLSKHGFATPDHESPTEVNNYINWKSAFNECNAPFTPTVKHV